MNSTMLTWRIADISNEIMYKKILVNVNLCLWLPIYGQRGRSCGQMVLFGQKSVFCLFESGCLQRDPVQFVTDFTTLVILIQLICVTCLAAED